MLSRIGQYEVGLHRTTNAHQSPHIEFTQARTTTPSLVQWGRPALKAATTTSTTTDGCTGLGAVLPMQIFRGYKTELHLNNYQRTRCHQHAGCARFAYNWGLRRKIESYHRTGRSPNARALHRELNQFKQTEFPWMYAVSKCAPQEALGNLDQAFQHFFRRVRQGERPGFPKFKA